VFSRQWASDYTIAAEKFAKHRLAPINWTLSELRHAFRLVPLNRTVPMKLCFFIDGLYEFDGGYEEMAKEIATAACGFGGLISPYIGQH
jgi:hypothetical protein